MPGAKRKGKELYKFFSFSFIALLVPFVFLSCLDWGKKKAAILLVSWQPVIGRGTSKAAARVPEDVQDLHQRLNFVGAPEVTRHLAFGAVKESYAEDEDYVLDVLEHLTQDLHSAMGFSSTLMASRSACVWLQCPARETGPGCVMQGPWPGPFAPRAKDQVRKIHQRGYATCAWLAIKASLALIAILKQSGYPLCTALLPLLLGKRKRLWQGSCHSGQVSQQSDTALTCSTTGIWALARTFVLPPWWCFCRCAMDPLWWRSLRRWPAFGDLSAGLGALESIYLKSKTCVGKPAEH